MQQSEEAAAEAVSERHGRLRFKGQRRIVQLQLVERVPQIIVMRTVRRINAAEHHRVDLFVSRQRRFCRVRGRGDGIADLRFRNALDGGGNVSHLACGQLVRRRELRRKHADLRHIELASRRHGTNAVARPHNAVHDAHKGQRALIVVVHAVKDKRRERCGGVSLGRRHEIHDLCKHFRNVLSAFCRDLRRVFCRDPDHILDLRHDVLRLCGRQVDLVDHRHDLEAVVHGKVHVCKRLRLDALRRVHDEHGALAGGKRTADFIGKVYVARRVDEIEHVSLAVAVGIEHAHSRCLDGNAALALDIHGIEQLLLHVARRDRIGQLHHAVCKRGFAVIDVRDDAEIADQFPRVGHSVVPPTVLNSEFPIIDLIYDTLSRVKLQESPAPSAPQPPALFDFPGNPWYAFDKS